MKNKILCVARSAIPGNVENSTVFYVYATDQYGFLNVRKITITYRKLTYVQGFAPIMMSRVTNFPFEGSKNDIPKMKLNGLWIPIRSIDSPKNLMTICDFDIETHKLLSMYPFLPIESLFKKDNHPSMMGFYSVFDEFLEYIGENSPRYRILVSHPNSEYIRNTYYPLDAYGRIDESGNKNLYLLSERNEIHDFNKRFFLFEQTPSILICDNTQIVWGPSKEFIYEAFSFEKALENAINVKHSEHYKDLNVYIMSMYKERSFLMNVEAFEKS